MNSLPLTICVAFCFRTTLVQQCLLHVFYSSMGQHSVRYCRMSFSKSQSAVKCQWMRLEYCGVNFLSHLHWHFLKDRNLNSRICQRDLVAVDEGSAVITDSPHSGNDVRGSRCPHNCCGQPLLSGIVDGSQAAAVSQTFLLPLCGRLGPSSQKLIALWDICEGEWVLTGKRWIFSDK